MKKSIGTALIASAFAFILASARPAAPQAANPQDVLKQYIAGLQRNPDDYALREKIIKLAQTMNPAPAIPEEAERRMARGAAAIKGAKETNDFRDAAAEFERATLAAPWLANAYYNLGVAQDKAGLYEAALKSLRLYLLAAPDASDAKQVKNLIYEVEYRQDKAAKESSPEAVESRKLHEYEEWLRKLDGARFKREFSSERDSGYWILDIQGNRVTRGLLITWSKFFPEDTGVFKGDASATLNGREFVLTSKYQCPGNETKQLVVKGRISDDGHSITTEECNNTYIYSRE